MGRLPRARARGSQAHFGPGARGSRLRRARALATRPGPRVAGSSWLRSQGRAGPDPGPGEPAHLGSGAKDGRARARGSQLILAPAPDSAGARAGVRCKGRRALSRQGPGPGPGKPAHPGPGDGAGTARARRGRSAISTPPGPISGANSLRVSIFRGRERDAQDPRAPARIFAEFPGYSKSPKFRQIFRISAISEHAPRNGSLV